jgi:hypothetical protein
VRHTRALLRDPLGDLDQIIERLGEGDRDFAAIG